MTQDLSSHGLTSGKEDKIKLLLQQRGVLLPAASNHGHILRWEAFAHHLRQQGAAGGGVSAGLHHGGVPRAVTALAKGDRVSSTG